MATPLAGWGEKQRAEFDREVRSRFFRGIDFAGPEGDPGWFGPDSAVWYVHACYPAITLGLFAASYIEGLDPSIVYMGADHSRIPERIGGIPTGKVSTEGAAVRFAHSLSFFLGTAFASTESAERLAKIVRSMHHTVKGVRPEVSSTGTRSRLASISMLIELAKPTLVCSITACGRPVIMV